GFAHAKRVTVKSQHKQSALLEIVLDEGRNREVRRLLARVGHKVLRLKRVGLGPLRLGDLGPGEVRPLRREEVRALREAARASIQRGGAAATIEPSGTHIVHYGGSNTSRSAERKGRRQQFFAARRRGPRR